MEEMRERLHTTPSEGKRSLRVGCFESVPHHLAWKAHGPSKSMHEGLLNKGGGENLQCCPRLVRSSLGQ